MPFNFTFAGKNSISDFQIFIDERPTIPSPERKIVFTEVPGRSSRLSFDENAFKDVTITVSCWIQGDEETLQDTLDAIKAWLLNSPESALVFSNQPNKKFIARVVNSIDFKVSNKLFGVFPIVFNCRPFKYLIDNSLITINASGTTVTNPGTFISEPIFKIFGTGNITLNIGSQTVTLTAVDEFVVIDSDLKNCYKGNALKNSSMVGDFPILLPGQNAVSWTGNCSKIEITPNFRFL